MNVLFVTYLYPPDIGGTSALAERAVTALIDAGHEVTVLTTTRSGACLTGDIRFLRVTRMPLLYIPRFWFKCWRHDRREKVDYILINDLPSAKSAAFTFSHRMLRKTILIVHGSEPENVFAAPSFMTRATLFRHFYRRLIRHCDSIVAFSSFMKAKLLRNLEDLPIENKLRVCRYVIGIQQVRSRRQTSRKQIRHPPANQYVVLTVSRIVERKGFERMLRIMSSVIARDQSVHWSIVGSGQYEGTLRRRIEEHSLQANVHLVGEISDPEQLALCYQGANVFLLLSEYEEGLGLVYVEAAAQGIPSIANDKSGEREAVEHGKSGFLTTSDEEVAEIILQRRAEPMRNSDSIYEFAAAFDTKYLPECMLNTKLPSL